MTVSSNHFCMTSQALTKNAIVLVAGLPGLGKTAICNSFIRILNRDGSRIHGIHFEFDRYLKMDSLNFYEDHLWLTSRRELYLNIKNVIESGNYAAYCKHCQLKALSTSHASRTGHDSVHSDVASNLSASKDRINKSKYVPEFQVVHWIFLDDNFMFQGMREEYMHLAILHDFPFMVVCLKANPELVEERNKLIYHPSGTYRLQPRVIESMIAKFDTFPPAWENNLVAEIDLNGNEDAAKGDSNFYKSFLQNVVGPILDNSISFLQEESKLLGSLLESIRMADADRKITQDSFFHQLSLQLNEVVYVLVQFLVEKHANFSSSMEFSPVDTASPDGPLPEGSLSLTLQDQLLAIENLVCGNHGLVVLWIIFLKKVFFRLVRASFANFDCSMPFFSSLTQLKVNASNSTIFSGFQSADYYLNYKNKENASLWETSIQSFLALHLKPPLSIDHTCFLMKLYIESIDVT